MKKKQVTDKPEVATPQVEPTPTVETPTNPSLYEYVEDNQMDFNSEVFDEGDIASALEMGFIAQALERHKEKVAPEKHPDFDGVHCVDCDIDIPQLRLNMGKVRCVDCQEVLEKKSKMRGK